ncbi:MAG: hypothetical protein IMF01_09360 [Proteobacteria bacterium]|nr:hypothetical protein [Pseudomonadota bacterium]
MTPAELKKELVVEAKAEGLDIAEESVKSIIKVAFKMLPKAVDLITNPTVKMIAGVAASSALMLEPKALEWADGIDGEVG